MVLDEEAIGGDVVAVDDEAVVAEVLVPADAGAVIGAPDPGVVDDGVVGVDARLTLALPTPAPPTRKKTSCREMGFLRVRAWLPCGPIFEQDGGVLLAGVEEQAGDVDAVDVGGGHGGGAVGGAQRGEAEAEDDGVGAGDADGLGRDRRCRE